MSFANERSAKLGHRQAGILVREVLNFRQTMKHDDWPCIIAGGKVV